MTVKHQSSLVLEGGGSRGVFTAGVLDYLMEKEVKFPYVVGVSAGSCNALDYVSWQPGRTRDCMIIEDKANSYIATKEALKKHELFDMDMLFDKYPNELFPFDFDTFFQSDTECELVVTNCQTGDAEYMTEKHDRRRLMDIGRASSSIPVVSPMVEIDGVPYLDGGIADSIPLIHAWCRTFWFFCYLFPVLLFYCHIFLCGKLCNIFIFRFQNTRRKLCIVRLALDQA